VRDENLTELLPYLPALASLVAFVAGYTRLGSAHQSLRKDFENEKARSERQRVEDNSARDRERTEDNKRVVDLFTQLRDDSRIVQADVKTLLQRDRGAN
jgi:hypothetical protein